MKNSILYIILIPAFLISISSCNAQKQKDKQINSIIKLAYEQIGKPYLYGGSSPSTGFDCSGLIYYLHQQNNINVPRSSRNYKNFGNKISLNEAQTGDVILFFGYKDSLRIGHVAIISKIENNQIWFIHSSSGKKHPGVIESNLQESAYLKRFVGIRRISNQ